MASGEFRQLAPATQKDRRFYLSGLADHYGDRPFSRMEQRHVRALRDERAAQPTTANGLLKALKACFKWAVEAGHCSHNPVAGVPHLRIRSDGHHTWTREEINEYLRYWGVGARQRLALLLLLYTGPSRASGCACCEQWALYDLAETMWDATP